METFQETSLRVSARSESRLILANNDKFQLYKSAFDLTVYIEECFRNFKRADKYTIGLELRKMVNDLLFKISTFNDLKREEKAAFCSELLKDIDKLQIKMNICRELGVFKGYKSWYHAAEMLFDINVQCEKLKKHFEGSGQNQGGSAPQ